MKRVVPALCLWFIVSNSNGQVQQYDLFEADVYSDSVFENPFTDVELKVYLIKPDGTSAEFWGFYRCGNRWSFRWMPDKVGRWQWHARFTSGRGEASGAFYCIPGDIPGLIGAYTKNPIWFAFAGNKPVLLRSLHVGDCFFADEPNTMDPEKKWSSALRREFLDWAQAQGYNMLSIGSHLLNRRENDRGQGWNTPKLWNARTGRPNPAEYDRMEAVLDDLAARRMIVYPFAGFFGKSADWPVDSTLRRIYLKYTLARLAPYWNLLFLVAGPEPLHTETGNSYQNAMAYDDINRWGNLIARLDPFGHLLSVHNRTEASEEGDPFKNQAWYTFSTIQGPKTLDRRLLAEKTLMNLHPAKPYYAQETLWAGNIWHPDYGLEDLRKNAVVLNMCAATINFADNDGNSSTGFSGLPLLERRVQEKHEIMKRVWDFFDSLPFFEMKPAPQCVDRGFCLAKKDSLMLVYLDEDGAFRILQGKGRYQLEWIHAEKTEQRLDCGTVEVDRPLKAPANGDWFAWLVRSE